MSALQSPTPSQPDRSYARPHSPFAARYVDYGKVFVPNGALDFSVLAASEPEVARFGPQLFNRGLVFPETSPFARQIGGVSAALLMFEGGYLFTLVQRRREGELSTDPRTDRPFNQVRFVILTRYQIEQAFAARTGLYTSLALAARDPAAKGWLKDYTSGGEMAEWNPLLDHVDPHAPAPEAVRFITNAVIAAAAAGDADGNALKPGQSLKPQAISVPLPGQDLLDKLRLVEAVQYWVLPRLGVLSFALDYVSLQTVHLRLFLLPPDAPAPLPPERVFAPGPTDARFTDDYYAAVSPLDHEALYDVALPGLLSRQFAASEAVDLFKIEKQAEPFAGAEALRLYPEMARLGDRRLNLLRRVPREDVLDLLRRADLPPDLRHDLLQIAFDTAHGQLVLYAPAHLAAPRAAREDERLRALLRAALAKSPETSLAVGTPEDQAELLYDLLRARRQPPPAKGQPAAPAPLTLAGGTPLLEALFLRRRTAALAAALQAVVPDDPALFGEALAILDQATDLHGLLWLWQHAGQDDFKRYTTLLTHAVEPEWYAQLAREAATWRDLLAAGRTLALTLPAAMPPAEGEPPTPVGALLRALPRELVPFVWQAGLATAEHDAAFAEWWLFNEALAMPEQLPAWWAAVQKLPSAALRAAGQNLKFMLGRETESMSLLEACTPPTPANAEADEALYATVLGGWLEWGFRSPVGPLALATDDVAFLISHLPGSNDILAAVAASATQAPAIHGLTSDEALTWARSAKGERRQPYHVNGKDVLFPRLNELPEPSADLLWHLLVEDDGTAPGAMRWTDYEALVARSRVLAQPLNLPPGSRLLAYLDVAAGLQNRELAETFAQNQIDIRRVFGLLAARATVPNNATDLLPLAVFHLQEANPDLKARAGELLRAGLQHADATTHLLPLPDNVLAYLRGLCVDGSPTLAAVGRWIEAELSRRTNAYKLEARLKASGVRRSQRAAPTAAPADGEAPPAPPEPVEAAAPISPAAMFKASANTPPPPPPESKAEAAAAAETNAGEMVPLLGELALPGATAAPKSRDSAAWLWIIIVVLGLLMAAVLIGVVVYIQSLS